MSTAPSWYRGVRLAALMLVLTSSVAFYAAGQALQQAVWAYRDFLSMSGRTPGEFAWIIIREVGLFGKGGPLLDLGVWFFWPALMSYLWSNRKYRTDNAGFVAAFLIALMILLSSFTAAIVFLSGVLIGNHGLLMVEIPDVPPKVPQIAAVVSVLLPIACAFIVAKWYLSDFRSRRRGRGDV